MGDLLDFNLQNIGELAFVMGLTLIIFWATSVFTNLKGIFTAGVLIPSIGVLLKFFIKLKPETYTLFQNKKENDLGKIKEGRSMVRDKL